MNRWQYPFHRKEEANKYLPEAEKKTGKKCFIRQVSVKAHIFKIFSSENEFTEYQKLKRTKHAH